MINQHQDVWLTANGNLATSVKYIPDGHTSEERAMYGKLREVLRRIAGFTPMQLATMKDDYDRLEFVYHEPAVIMSDDTRKAIKQALVEGKVVPPPLMPPTDYELIAYIDDVKKLKAVETVTNQYLSITKGQVYEFWHDDPKFVEKFARRYRDGDLHDCELKGKDSAFKFLDDMGTEVTFRQHYSEDASDHELDEALIWDYFEKPHVKCIAEKYPDQYESNMETLTMMEMLYGSNPDNPWTFYEAQKKYIASMAIPKSALISAETGCGKSLMAIAITMCKGPVRTLLVAPKGTVKGEEDQEAAQWLKEYQVFDPDAKVYKIFSRKDYKAILKANNGTLPPGTYVTYDHAFFKTNAIEDIPRSWKDNRRGMTAEECFRTAMEIPKDQYAPPIGSYISDGVSWECDGYVEGLGQTRNGIKCIARPCLAQEIGQQWQMMILDEAHLMSNPSSIITQRILRMQPEYRFALTATPIPNKVENIFPLMGWLCVPGWYKGDVQNPRWPFNNSPKGRSDFNQLFVAYEYDLVARMKNKSYAPKMSPIIGQTGRLLKLMNPTKGHISKEQCNPDMVPCEIIETRVPMGEEQARMYSFFMNIDNVMVTNNHMMKAGVQLNYLRGACAAPTSGQHAEWLRKATEVTDSMGNILQEGWVPKSQFTPKIVATLETALDCIQRGEQVLIVYCRTEMGSELASRFHKAGISYSRIDSTVKHHATEASLFKQGRTNVMLMGIKCAQAYSFSNCRNLIIASLEWSYGVFNQALGRVYRLNSPKPVKVYVILMQNSIEEAMYDKLGSKEDTAKICLHGERVPRNTIPMDANEIFADHLGIFNNGSHNTVSEYLCEEMWPDLRTKFEEAIMNKEVLV
jgi:superfamily II DNA or RNA helicase